MRHKCISLWMLFPNSTVISAEVFVFDASNLSTRHTRLRNADPGDPKKLKWIYRLKSQAFLLPTLLSFLRKQETSYIRVYTFKRSLNACLCRLCLQLTQLDPFFQRDDNEWIPSGLVSDTGT